MYAQVEKPKQNNSRVVANSVGQKKSNGRQGFGFVDNRQYTMTNREANIVLDELKLHIGNLTPEGEAIAIASRQQRVTIRDYAHFSGLASKMHITVVDDRTNRTYQVPVHSRKAGQWNYDVNSSITG
ncbi:MAG: hypothetical protein COA38_01820 [Fluviicola sp.]|nr:MAG: hypothetical protein COA38_01820 [Fluviicola sp.]